VSGEEESFEETPLAQSRRHVLEGEEMVARQRALVEEVDREHPEIAAQARRVLAIMEETLRLSRQHLEQELLKEAKDRG
jgi:hypothetical protein